MPDVPALSAADAALVAQTIWTTAVLDCQFPEHLGVPCGRCLSKAFHDAGSLITALAEARAALEKCSGEGAREAGRQLADELRRAQEAEATAARERDALKKGLARFGGHMPECAFEKGVCQCDCGYAALLAAPGGAEG